MTEGRSDHLPLFLSFSKQRHNDRRPKPLFRFEASWINNEEGEHVVRTSWLPVSDETRDLHSLAPRLD